LICLKLLGSVYSESAADAHRGKKTPISSTSRAGSAEVAVPVDLHLEGTVRKLAP
jgi:hypothetical protein